MSPRQLIEEKAAARRFTMSELSRMLGRNVAYVQQYVRRGTPRYLAERDRHALAAILGVDHMRLIEPELRGENDNDRGARVEGLAIALWERSSVSFWEDAGDQWREQYRGMASYAVDWLDKHDGRVAP